VARRRKYEAFALALLDDGAQPVVGHAVVANTTAFALAFSACPFDVCGSGVTCREYEAFALAFSGGAA